MTEKKSANKSKPKSQPAKAKLESPIEEIFEKPALVKTEEKTAYIFMKQNAFLKGLPPMYTHIRYRIPESRLKEIPKDNYILLTD